MADNKTEQATPGRLKKAREQGQVARSRELPAALSLIAAIGPLIWIGHSSLAHWASLYRYELDLASTEDLRLNNPALFWSAVEVLRLSSPILLVCMLVSLTAGLAQGGVNFAPQALAFKFDRFNPASRLSQLFSSVALSNLLKSLVPFSAIIWIAFAVIRANWGVIVHASTMGNASITSVIGSMLLEVTWKSCLVLLAWSGVDYVFTWRKMNSELKMTKQEVREEMKETEGNPVIKGRVRQIQRAMRRRRSLKDAATATVIITNPTHFAVALRYGTEMVAPVVVAKGRDLLAEKIKQIGRDNGIVMVENKPLAQALFKSVEIGECIPASLYEAVAEILAMVYRAQAEIRRRDAERRSRNASGKVVQRQLGRTGDERE